MWKILSVVVVTFSILVIIAMVAAGMKGLLMLLT
jgi:hypothetical protein